MGNTVPIPGPAAVESRYAHRLGLTVTNTGVSPGGGLHHARQCTHLERSTMTTTENPPISTERSDCEAHSRRARCAR